MRKVRKIFVLTLAFVMLFTNINVGMWGTDEARAAEDQDFKDFFAEVVNAGIAEVANDTINPFTKDIEEPNGPWLKSGNANQRNTFSTIVLNFDKAATLIFDYKVSSGNVNSGLEVKNGKNTLYTYSPYGYGSAIKNCNKYAEGTATINAEKGDKVTIAYYRGYYAAASDAKDCIFVNNFRAVEPHKVIFHSNEGLNQETIKEQGIFTTAKLEKNTFQREGYKFIGWSSMPDGNVEYADMAYYTIGEENVNLYAVWVPVYDLIFKISPDSADFSLYANEEKTNEIGENIGKKYTYTLEDGTYHWKASAFGYDDKEGTVAINKAGRTVNVNLEKQPTYTVTFNYDGKEPSTIENGSLTVKTGAREMQPDQTENTVYSLPVGYYYEYTFKSDNYSKVYGTLDLTGITNPGTKNIKITLSEKNAWEGADDIIKPSIVEGVYQIESGAELAWIAQEVNTGRGANCNAVLIKDIDLGKENWTPIGKSIGFPFKGKLDGQGFKIKNLHIDTTNSYQGLFGYTNGAAISNLNVSGDIKAGQYAAGIIGCAGYGTSIEQCISKVNMECTSGFVGGLVGDLHGSNINVKSCAHIGNVSGKGYNVGGLIGRIDNKSFVENCYNRGDVTNKAGYTGGLVGFLNNPGATLQNCYAVGTITGASDSNPGLGKKNSGTIKDCYYLASTGTDVNVTAKSENEMKSPAFVTLLGDAFIKDMPENINDGYPILAFQDTTPRYDVTINVVPDNAVLKVLDENGIKAVPVSENKGTYKYYLKEGEYTYSASAFGYVKEKGDIKVTDNPLGLVKNIRLKEADRYQLIFNVTPKNEPNTTIQVSYDGKVIAPISVGEYNLPEGEYTWIVKAKGYARQTDTIQLTKSETVNVTLTKSNTWDGESKDEPSKNAEGYYEISTGSELAWLAEQVNNGIGKEYKAILTEDIDLGNNSFTPIGKGYSYPYMSTFDGQGNTVSGLNISNAEYAGLFGYAKNATIKNLVIKGNVIGTGYSGGVLGRGGSNCAIENCGNEANVTGTGAKTGGLVGQIESSYSIKNNYNIGRILGAKKSGSYTGGILGYDNAKCTIEDCYNTGEVSGYYAGGIRAYGSGSAGKIANCYNVGTVTGNDSSKTGSIVPGRTSTIMNCYYLEGSAPDLNSGLYKKTAEELKGIVSDLNGERTGDSRVWKSVPSENNGYPILSWQMVDIPEAEQPLAAAQNVHWKYKKEDYIDPYTQELIPADENSWNCFICMEPIAMWDAVPNAASYTVVLWKEGFVWQELDDSKQDFVKNKNNRAADRLKYVDESCIVKALTADEKRTYESLEAAITKANANLDGSKESIATLKAAINARQEFLVSKIDDGKHDIKLGTYKLGVEKIKQVENVTYTTYDFTSEIKSEGEYAYYFTVTPIAAQGSGYISGTVPENMTSLELSELYDDDWTCCYKHLTKPYNLQWDGTVAKWCGSENADFYSFALYSVSGTEEAPVYTLLRYEIIEPKYNQIDCGRYFTVDGRYAFAVRSEAGEEGKIKGHFSSGISEYSPIYTVGNVQIPNEDRTDWTAISSAEEWIELANIEDIPVGEGDKSGKQAVSWGKKYYLTNDIDFSGLSALNQAKTKSIGNINNRFMGTMDGNGHKITGLTLSNNDSGLFAYIGATGLVYNLTIENANVLFSDNAAVLAHNNYGTIMDCAVKNCNVTTDTGAVIGGIVSRNYGIIKNSYVEGGTLTSNSTTATGHAGFVGSNEKTGLIEQCWTSMDVNTQSDYAGGFIGLGYGGTIKNCFALGNVASRDYSGGFVGRSAYNGNVYENCYAGGIVTVTGKEGHGFIGGNKPGSAFQYNQSEGIKNCYYTSESLEDKNGAVKKTISEMQNDTFLKQLNSNGNAWIQNSKKNNGMPFLRDVKAPENASTDSITVEIAIATYNKEKYTFEKAGNAVSVILESNGNTRVVDLMDAAVSQKLLTYSYDTNSAFGRYIHTINGKSVESPDGWMFTINDALSNVSASLATVKDGDKLLWYEGTTENLFKAPLWSDFISEKEENWININSVEDLIKLTNNSNEEALGQMYRLGKNLNLTGIEFNGIASKDKPFTGVFDGQNYTISNVTVKRSEDCTGFFNAIKGAVVKNLKLEYVNIEGTSRVGGLAGFAMAELDDSNMSESKANLIGNCSVSGTVKGSDTSGAPVGSVGGLVGENGGTYDNDTLFSAYSSVDKCVANVNVTGNYKTGGLVGNNGGNITKSSSSGTVKGETVTGGFVGDSTGNIYDCHSKGEVTGSNHTGGFAGYSEGEVKNAYSLGNVIGIDYTGSFAGAISNAKFVIGAGTVTIIGIPTNGYNGGFAGNLGGTLTGVENKITIKDAYGNCVGMKGVIGNSSSYSGNSQKEKLAKMTLSTLPAVGEKLYEMFGVNMPSSLESEAGKLLDVISVGENIQAEQVINTLKENTSVDDNVTVTYKVDPAGEKYLEGGSSLKIKLINDTASILEIPVTIELRSVEGTFNKIIKVVFSVSEDKKLELMDTIAEKYKGSSDQWTVMDMKAYASITGKTIETDEKALQNALNTLITKAASSNATAGDRARVEIVLRAMGIDSTKLYKANSTVAINNAEALNKMNMASVDHYAAPWILLANMQGNVKLSDEQINTLIGKIESNLGNGMFGYEWGGVTYSDPDTAAASITALARFYDSNAEAKYIVDKVLKALQENIEENGSFGNANSDAMVIIGLLAAGKNPKELKSETGLSIIDGLLSYVNEEGNGFLYLGKDNNLATEQAFRALVALAKYGGTAAYNIYDFSNEKVVPGHATGEGKVEVPEEPSTDEEITTTVTIKTYTDTWLNNQIVKVKKGSTVYHAFVTALELSDNMSQNGAESGYVKSITKGGVTLGEFDKGENSGWLYKVNGELPKVALTAYELSDGDNILWYYTVDWKKDPSAGAFAESKKEVTTSGPVGYATTTTPTKVIMNGTTATATITKENTVEILKQANENKSTEIKVKVDTDASKNAESIQLKLDTSFVKDIVSKTSAILNAETPNGSVTLERAVLSQAVSEGKGNTITLEVIHVKKPTKEQKEVAGENAHFINLILKSGDKIISMFNKGKATVKVEIPKNLLDKKVAAVYIGADNKLEKLEGSVITEYGKKHYEFTTPHFSTFALVDAEVIGLETYELTAGQVREKVADIKLIARSAKTSKKNVKVILNINEANKTVINQLRGTGYSVKYKFYRSSRKASQYAAKSTSETGVYINTAGKKGTKYYYKARIQVYDVNGMLVAQTQLKQCKYAYRTWNK